MTSKSDPAKFADGSRLAAQASISMSMGALILYAIFVVWLQSTVNKAFVGGSIAPLGWFRFKNTPSRLPR